jgi:hypothetical protein
MHTNGVPQPLPDLSHFDENRANYPPELLVPFAGQHVAWSLDGTRILASGKDMLAVEKKLVAAGIDPSRVVHDYCERL